VSGPSNRALAALATVTAPDLAELCAAFHAGLGQRLTEAEAGPAASTTDRGGRSGWATHADPTAVAALAGLGFDLAVAHRHELDRCLRDARARIRRALRIAAAYPPPHPAGVADRLALGRANSRPPGCESCARLRNPAGDIRWEPLDGRLAGPTDAGGRLPAPVGLCRWCNDRVRMWGRLPTPDELERHHRGSHVPWPADVERPA
jgi:hypothetical protein